MCGRGEDGEMHEKERFCAVLPVYPPKTNNRQIIVLQSDGKVLHGYLNRSCVCCSRLFRSLVAGVTLVAVVAGRCWRGRSVSGMDVVAC